MSRQRPLEKIIISEYVTVGELVRLRYIDGLKWEQVNERLYISPTTSKRLHHAALKKMGLA